MPQDKYSALYVSYSSISDFQKCPRLYYLKNVYKNPQTGHRIQLMTPNLAVGQIVHEVLESLSILPKESRFKNPPWKRLDKLWQKITGKKGGFRNQKEEENYFRKAKEMIGKVFNHPGPLANLSVKIKSDLPQYYLSEEENIILCGRIDWLEYLPEEKTVHIIDFKTGSKKEKPGSLQLPIYQLVAEHCQKHSVAKVSYWYLQLEDAPSEIPLVDSQDKEKELLVLAKQISLARKLERFKCQYDGCKFCKPYEKILLEETEFVSVDERNKDIFIPKHSLSPEYESEIL